MKSWIEMKKSIHTELMARELSVPRLRLAALEGLEHQLSAIWPEFTNTPQILLVLGKEAVLEKLAGRKGTGSLNGAERSVLNDIFAHVHEDCGGTVAERAERFCRWFLRFNGFFSIENFIVTPLTVKVLADEFLAPLNNGTMSPASTMTLNQFIEKRYLPFVEANKEPSTYACYKNSFNLHIKKHGSIALRDVRTVEIEDMLTAIAREFDTAKSTIAHDKMFLSGTFRYAKRQGVINTQNPVPDAVLPKCKETEDTYAYSLEDELTMISILPEPASTIVAMAAFTGLRKGEIRGADWDRYNGDVIYVAKSVWRKHVKGPKTRVSKAPVPVIAQLASKLDEYRKSCGSPKSGWLFIAGM